MFRGVESVVRICSRRKTERTDVQRQMRESWTIFLLDGWYYLLANHPSLILLFPFEFFLFHFQKQAGADSSVLLLRMDLHGRTECPGKRNYPKVPLSFRTAVFLCRIPWVQGCLSTLRKVRSNDHSCLLTFFNLTHAADPFSFHFFLLSVFSLSSEAGSAKTETTTPRTNWDYWNSFTTWSRPWTNGPEVFVNWISCIN